MEDTAAGGCTEGDGESAGEKRPSEEMGREFLQAGAGTFVTTLCMYAFHICSVAVCGINACWIILLLSSSSFLSGYLSIYLEIHLRLSSTP